MRVGAIIFVTILLTSVASAAFAERILEEEAARYARGGLEPAQRASVLSAALATTGPMDLGSARDLVRSSAGNVADPAFDLASRAMAVVPPSNVEEGLDLAAAWVPGAGSADVFPRIVAQQERMAELEGLSHFERLLALLDGGTYALPPLPRSPDLATALADFAPVDASTLATAHAIPEPTAGALVRILDAHRWQGQVAPGLVSLPEPLRTQALLALQRELVEETMLAIPDITCGWGDITLPGLVLFELDCVDSVYPTHVYLIVDAGGNDVYRNNAGGGTFAGMLLDVRGNDRYYADTDRGYFTGAGRAGSGFHLDETGNDWYEANLTEIGGTTGSAIEGAGFHADLYGHDTRITRNIAGLHTVAHGSGSSGVGILYDGGGNDDYLTVGVDESIGSSALGGSSIFYDGDGDDSYVALASEVAIGSTYAGSAQFYEAGGHDTYEALGARTSIGSAEVGSALFYEVSGDDTMLATGSDLWAIGSVLVGSAAFYDEGGNDTRTVLGQDLDAMGSSRGGEVLFVDMDAGDDRYTTEMWAGSTVGSGIGSIHFIEDGGDDEYITRQTGYIETTGQWGTGTIQCDAVGAIGLGTSVFIEAGGTDRYQTTLIRNGSAHGATTAGGVSFFLDYNGNDSYRVEGSDHVTANGAASLGSTSYFFDLLGDDTYEAVGRAPLTMLVANGAAWAGTALLHDLNGRDTYRVEADGDGAANGAGRFGAGILIDGLGNDTYEAEHDEGASNGAAWAGVGLLIDGSGTNTFQGPAGVVSVSNGAARGHAFDLGVLSLPYASAVGILLGGSGDDTYTGGGVTQGASDAGFGMLVDQGGDNTFIAWADALAQGAGRAGGVGILIDEGSVSTFSLGERAVGQGAGLQGLGLLERTSTLGGATYFAADGSFPLHMLGAGLAVRIDEGPATVLEGVLPDMSCVDPDDEIERRDVYNGADLVATVRTCAPNEASSQAIRSPGGGPVAPIGKPSCAALPGCTAALDLVGVLNDDQREWLDASSVGVTASGGLKVLYVSAQVETAAALQVTHEIQSIDRVCKMSCFLLEA